MTREPLTIAIIGGGHNGLTAAAYLAAHGFTVEIFEKRDIIGGLCVNETPFLQSASKAKVSSVASYFGMMRKEIMADLNLESYGLKPYLTDPVEIVLLDSQGGQDQFSFTPRDGGGAKAEIASLTAADQAGWQEFWADIQKAAALIYPRYLSPDLTQAEVVELLKKNGLDKVADNIFAGSLVDLLKLYLQNEGLMAVAATCTPGFANLVGSVFGCIHHGTAETKGEFGAWGQVHGGMGAITEALSKSAQENGATIHLGQAVKRLLTSENEEDKKITSIELGDGTTRQFDLVVVNADSYVLFEQLLAPTALTEEIRQYLKDNRPKVSAAKIHFLLRELPAFRTLSKIDHNHKGVIVMAPPLEAVKAASSQVPNGTMPDRLMLTMAFPTLEDATMKGVPGSEKSREQVLSVDIHYVPAQIAGRAWSEEDDSNLLERAVKAIEAQCPEFRSLILASYVVSPRALASDFNLASLSCWHLPMTPEYLFEKRTLPGCAPYETPFKNLFLCGAGTYPGGNVTAANGHNIAKHLINRFSEKEVEDDAQRARVYN
ncbi:MAG: NAD(P)/FAD-dependent oxidoreductase [Candidatus Melainabacteria bacterium]|nr:NAD(P)/FAD-dependent oxidoreductase [Candidatus Melainabacteria bacterium]